MSARNFVLAHRKKDPLSIWDHSKFIWTFNLIYKSVLIYWVIDIDNTEVPIIRETLLLGAKMGLSPKYVSKLLIEYIFLSQNMKILFLYCICKKNYKKPTWKILIHAPVSGFWRPCSPPVTFISHQQSFWYFVSVSSMQVF